MVLIFSFELSKIVVQRKVIIERNGILSACNSVYREIFVSSRDRETELKTVSVTAKS